MKTVIFHDNCVDGFTAAWAAWYFLGEDGVRYIRASYGSEPPDVTGDEVYILDFSYPRAVLLEMKEKAKSILVLDHDKTAQADLAGLDFAVFDMDRSGAGMAWDHFSSLPQSRPWLVSYVEDRDLWRFRWPDSEAVNAFVGAEERTFQAWSAMSCMPLQHAAKMGAAIRKYVERYVEEVCLGAMRVPFAGYENIPIVNAPYKGISEVVGKLAESAPFAIGWHQRASGRFAFSLRSRRQTDGSEVDVSAIAMVHGGGGHRNSAGFVRDRLFDFILEAVPDQSVGAKGDK